MSNGTTTVITITLVNNENGQSEIITIDPITTTLNELIEWSKALFGLSGDDDDITFVHNGKSITPTTTSTTTTSSQQENNLTSYNIQNGDLLMVLVQTTQQQQQRQVPAAVAPSTSSGSTSNSTNGGGLNGGLDFTNLLQSAAGVTASSSTITPAPSSSSSTVASSSLSFRTPEPIYYNGMNLDDAIQQNPHPKQFVTLLLNKQHLLKELNYHNPKLALQFYNGITIDDATTLWRNELVKGSIQSAMKASENYHLENTMQQRLNTNPTDMEAIEYFQKRESQKLINIQYEQMMEEYPEALGRVLMLYIQVTINGTPIQAFCDTGAQATIMSYSTAKKCQIDHLIDTRFAGTVVGVGTGIILGRIHIVQLQINTTYFPCSVTVMEDPPIHSAAKPMPFLLGLDMMKRHLCNVNLQKGTLEFTLPNQTTLHAHFLHEKDLSMEQGGTQGYDPSKDDTNDDDNNNNNTNTMND